MQEHLLLSALNHYSIWWRHEWNPQKGLHSNKRPHNHVRQVAFVQVYTLLIRHHHSVLSLFSPISPTSLWRQQSLAGSLDSIDHHAFAVVVGCSPNGCWTHHHAYIRKCDSCLNNIGGQDDSCDICAPLLSLPNSSHPAGALLAAHDSEP